MNPCGKHLGGGHCESQSPDVPPGPASAGTEAPWWQHRQPGRVEPWKMWFCGSFEWTTSSSQQGTFSLTSSSATGRYNLVKAPDSGRTGKLVIINYLISVRSHLKICLGRRVKFEKCQARLSGDFYLTDLKKNLK